MDIEAKKLIFNKVRCSGYLKSVSDGRRMEEQPDGSVKYMVRGEEVPDMKCDRSGKLDFLKTFYEHTDEEFTGIVTTIKRNVTISHYLACKKYGTGQSEVNEFYTVPNESKDCAIVLYDNNKRHVVPLDDIVSLIVPVETKEISIDKIR